MYRGWEPPGLLGGVVVLSHPHRSPRPGKLGLPRGLHRLGGRPIVDGCLLGGLVAAHDVIVAVHQRLEALPRDLGLVVLPTVVAEDGVPHPGVGVEVAVGCPG